MYPKWRFHKELGEKIVKNKEEEHALGKDWHESPADFDKEECIANPHVEPEKAQPIIELLPIKPVKKKGKGK
jgi:hypothetical protein